MEPLSRPSYNEGYIHVGTDGYDYHKLGMSLEDVLNNPKRKMGHAFVIAMILANDLCWRR